MEESEYYSRYQRIIPHDDVITNDVIPIQMEKMAPLSRFPGSLDAWTFPTGSAESRLDAPGRSLIGTYDYYCLDLASLMPVLMLDIQSGMSVLDMCAAPGGKSFAMLQTMLPARVSCNDNNKSRLHRVRRVVNQYFQGDNGQDYAKDLVEYTSYEGHVLGSRLQGQYDRVLCDVECTTDRHALVRDEGNWFAPQFKKQRLRLPEMQSELLQSALKCLKPGGSLVYSTCSLSPVQNDGVVYTALKQIWSDTRLEFVVNDLSDAIEPFREMMKLTSKVNNMRYGQMVLPYMPNNFGPMYFSKITRTS